jgi:hypothetical protein
MTTIGESRDGTGCGDHDQPYVFGGYPWALMNIHVHASLLVMRGHILDARRGVGRYVGDVSAEGPDVSTSPLAA